MYINDEGAIVPPHTITYLPYHSESAAVEDQFETLVGKTNRDWFPNPAMYMCLPLVMGNQHGFVVKALYDIELYWDGSAAAVEVKSEGFNNHSSPQAYMNPFGSGILTIENRYILKTPPGVNLMTIAPPNYFIPGIHVMTGVVETDNLRRNFDFNLKVTIPNATIKISKGDWLAAFLPVPRHFVDEFTMVPADTLFDQEVLDNELKDFNKLVWERNNRQEDGGDQGKPYMAGRRYFKGIHANDSLYKDHQNRIG